MTTGFKFSPIRLETGFISYQMLVLARHEAYKALQKFHHIDLAQPPTSSVLEYEVVTDHGRVIGAGLMGIGEGELKTYEGKTGRVYPQSVELTGLTRSRMRVVWRSEQGAWKVSHFLPEGQGWDNEKQQYTNKDADVVISGVSR